MDANSQLEAAIRALAPAPHDALFRACMNDPRRAAALVREHCPESLRGFLRGEARHASSAGIPEHLRRSLADCVLEFGGIPGAPECVVITEHTSSSRRSLFGQLAGYWTNWYKLYEDRNAYPRLLLFLVHSGPRPLRVPGALICPRGDGRHFLVNNDHWLPLVLLDLSVTPKDSISRYPAARAVLGVLAVAQVEPAPEATIRKIFRDLNTLPWKNTLWHKSVI